MVFKSHNTLLVIGLCLLAGTFAQTINFPAFEQYVTAYNKTYNSVEAASRKTIYDARVAILKTITVYTPAVNNFTDWSDDELKSNLLFKYRNQGTSNSNIPQRKHSPISNHKPTFKSQLGNPQEGVCSEKSRKLWKLLGFCCN